MTYPGKRVTTLEEVDELLQTAAEKRKISEGKFLEVLGSFWLDSPPPEGVDPWSPDYSKHWLDLYKQLADREYSIDNEKFDFDVNLHSTNPYPFCTQSHEIVGKQLMAIGHIIRVLNLPPQSEILEMGAGWGNTSLFLAQMGHQVTVVDINQHYGDLLKKRASSLGVNVNFACMPFEKSSELDMNFDCILFFESFHHSHNHLALLDLLRSLIRPGGILVLSGEPMTESLPYEWGLNPAGEALYQMRTHGWFELAFRETYLVNTLERKGWNVKKHELHNNPIGTTLICS